MAKYYYEAIPEGELKCGHRHQTKKTAQICLEKLFRAYPETTRGRISRRLK